jgi:hypothetical protein
MWPLIQRTRCFSQARIVIGASSQVGGAMTLARQPARASR